MTPFRFDKKVKELGTAQGLRERRLRYILASLAGGALIVPLATTVRLQGGGVLQIAVFFAIPLFAYVVVLRSRFWSLLTGLALIAITAWSSIGYAKALGPDSSGLEGLWLLFGLFWSIAVVSAGGLLDRFVTRN